MTKNAKQKLTLDRPALYKIRVPGKLDAGWSDWAGDITVSFETDDHGQQVTTLTGTIDQAALLGLLRRLYSLGIPLLSAICVGIESST